MSPTAAGIPQRREPGTGDVTPRVVLAAILLLALSGVVGFWLDCYYRVNSRFGAGTPASGPFVLLFLLAGAATLLGRRLTLTRRQLFAIYMIVLIPAPVISYKGMESILVHATIQRYLGMTTHLDWQDTFLNRIPPWLAPTDRTAVEAFYHGQSAVSWNLWWTPLLVWCSFMVALGVCSICLVLLLQRQWISHERLTFPLAQVPLVMVPAEEAGSPKGRLTPNSLFWLGLAVSFGLTALDNASQLIPALPAINLGPIRLMEWHPTGPLAGLDEINLVMWPWLVAIAYLIPRDLAFSCWFFWFVRLSLHAIAIAAGAIPQRPAWHWVSEFPAPLFQGTGALLAISALALWSARRHLSRALHIALSRQSGRADADEPIPYRWTLLAFLISFAWMLGICAAAGCRLYVAAGLILFILVYFLTWQRLRAETGLGFIPYPLFVHQSITVPVGSAAFNPAEIIMIHATHWSYHGGGDSFELVGGNALESLKIGDVAGMRMRPVILGTAVGFLLVVALGAWLTLTVMYRYGFLNTGVNGIEHELNVYSGSLYEYFVTPGGPDAPGAIAMAAGAAVTLALGAMRLRFWWWPFHPIGYLAANTWVMYMYWSPFFIGWLLKTLVTRYSGLRLYRQTIPIAIGFIAGDLLNDIVWSLATLITGIPLRFGRPW
jgi:hypothetical protein